MSPKILVVVGATGGQGSGVIHHFQHHYSHIKLRGLTRTPTSPAALSLAKTGVEMIQADLNDLASLKQAFKSANYIFAYTDFGSIISSPAVMGRFTAGDLVPPIGAESYKIEVQQGRNIADAAAGVPELERLVWSGLADVRKWSAGKYTRVFHFDAKAAVTAYTFGHEGLRGKVRCVQMGAFLGNFVKGLEMFGFSVVSNGFFFFFIFPEKRGGRTSMLTLNAVGRRWSRREIGRLAIAVPKPITLALGRRREGHWRFREGAY